MDEATKRNLFFAAIAIGLVAEAMEMYLFFSKGDTVGTVIAAITLVVVAILGYSFAKGFWKPWERKK